ncbi:MAG: branched-chain amino acid ABC transporter permease [Actinomycetota bacterium]|nr:branched-chain amino acid ABC transporter permease [Actinomycetota bacterium]
MAELLQLVVNGLVTGSIIAISAIGLTLVYGILRIVNFAHGDYLTFGAYIAFTINVTLGANMIVATLFAMIATAFLGLGLEYVLWRPMRRKGAGVVSLFITSIGLALVLRDVNFLIWGAQGRRYNIDVFQVYRLGFLRLSLSQIVTIAISATAILLVAVMLARTRLGKAMRALSDNRSLASVAGIDVDRVTASTWFIGSALAGLGGVLIGLVQSSFEPNTGASLLLPIFAAVILGGVGNAYGALVGGLTLGVAMEVSTWSGLGGGIDPIYKPVVAFVVLIVMLLLRPQGLFGNARVL